MRRRATMFLLAFALPALAACNPAANLGEAADQIDRYQFHYTMGEFDDMYAMTGPAFREAAGRDQFGDFVRVVSTRLGPIESTERVNFNVNTSPTGTLTVVTMRTRFEQGDGTETYTFSGHGEGMKIEGWKVNSQRLMVSAQELDALAETEATPSR
jgi:hypothetical protein